MAKTAKKENKARQPPGWKRGVTKLSGGITAAVLGKST
jgi:hypothetical protein